MVYLCNAFSLQMIDINKKQTVNIEPIDVKDVPVDFVSAIGHADTAAVVADILKAEVHANRMNVKLNQGDVLIVAQVTGGRLPEGCTTLPEGFEIQFVKVILTDQ